MSKQSKAQVREREAEEVPETESKSEKHLVELMDDILDDIDTALEENALEVTRSYRQRGGE